jgi:hypothetical protein
MQRQTQHSCQTKCLYQHIKQVASAVLCVSAEWCVSCSCPCARGAAAAAPLTQHVSHHPVSQMTMRMMIQGGHAVMISTRGVRRAVTVRMMTST